MRCNPVSRSQRALRLMHPPRDPVGNPTMPACAFSKMGCHVTQAENQLRHQKSCRPSARLGPRDIVTTKRDVPTYVSQPCLAQSLSANKAPDARPDMEAAIGKAAPQHTAYSQPSMFVCISLIVTTNASNLLTSS